jgi:hypothetical protein
MEKRGNGEAVKRRNREVGKFAPSRFTHYELRITLPINCCCISIKGGKTRVKRRGLWFFQEATLLVAIVVLVAITAWRDIKFLNAYNLQVITREAALFSIMGIGETLVILTGGIDLSPGSMVALSGVVVAYLIVFA